MSPIRFGILALALYSVGKRHSHASAENLLGILQDPAEIRWIFLWVVFRAK